MNIDLAYIKNKFFKKKILILAIFLCFLITHYLIKIFKKDELLPLIIKKGSFWYIPKDSTLRDLLKIEDLKVSAKVYTLHFPAHLEIVPNNQVKIHSPIPGKILHVLVKTGDALRKKDKIIVLFSSEFANSYSEFLKIRSAKKLASEQLNRIREVQKVGASAVKEVEIAQAKYEQLAADYKRLFLRFKIFGGIKNIVNNGVFNINSPITGKVIDTAVSQGVFINNINKSLMTIAKLDPLWVSFCVREDLIKYINIGQEISIKLDAFPNNVFKSTVLLINPKIDYKTRCNWVKAELQNYNELLQPNMFADVKVFIKQSSIITVPKSAILMNNEDQTVFIVLKPWHIKRQKIVTGREYQNSVEVLSGLKFAKQIVARGGIYINDQ